MVLWRIASPMVPFFEELACSMPCASAPKFWNFCGAKKKAFQFRFILWSKRCVLMRGLQIWSRNSNWITFDHFFAGKLSKTGKIPDFVFWHASENHISPDPVNYLTKVELWDTLMHMFRRVSTKTQWRSTFRLDFFVQKYFTTSNFDIVIIFVENSCFDHPLTSTA